MIMELHSNVKKITNIKGCRNIFTEPTWIN